MKINGAGILNNEHALKFIKKLGAEPSKEEVFKPLLDVMNVPHVSFELAAKSLVSQVVVFRKNHPNTGPINAITKQFEPVSTCVSWEVSDEEYYLLWDALERVFRDSEFPESFHMREPFDLQCQKQAVKSIASSIIKHIDKGEVPDIKKDTKVNDIEIGDLFCFEIRGLQFLAQCFKEDMFTIWQSDLDGFPGVLSVEPLISCILLNDTIERMRFSGNSENHMDPKNFYYKHLDPESGKTQKQNIVTREIFDCSLDEYNQCMEGRIWGYENFFWYLNVAVSGGRFIDRLTLFDPPNLYQRPKQWMLSPKSNQDV